MEEYLFNYIDYVKLLNHFQGGNLNIYNGKLNIVCIKAILGFLAAEPSQCHIINKFDYI